MLVELDDEHIKCSICVAKFSSDIDCEDPEIRKHLPVLSSSQRCDHWFCHDCILREQQRVAEENNGRIPKWIKCMHCREKTSFNPAEPKYHRLLIDLLGRAQKYAAAQVKLDERDEMRVGKQLASADAHCMKKESDTGDEDEQELKRSDLSSPQLRHVKEEPVEYDDQCYDPLPQLQIESTPTPSEMVQLDADSSNDEQSPSSDRSTPIKRESDEVDEEEEQELKPITQVKEEPIECHDPLLEGVSEESQLAQPAMSAYSTDDQSDEDTQVNGDAADDDYELEVNRTKLMIERDQSDTDSTNDQPGESTMERLCADCKLEYPPNCFTMNELAKGDSATCVTCYLSRLRDSTTFQSDTDYANDEQEEDTVVRHCAKCKAAKTLDCYSQNQLGKGDSAKCKECIQGQKRGCFKCNKSKLLKCFPKKQLEKGDYARCRSCVIHFKCNRCRAAKEKYSVIFSHHDAQCNRYHVDGRRKQRDDVQDVSLKQHSQNGKRQLYDEPIEDTEFMRKEIKAEIKAFLQERSSSARLRRSYSRSSSRSCSPSRRRYDRDEGRRKRDRFRSQSRSRSPSRRRHDRDRDRDEGRRKRDRHHSRSRSRSHSPNRRRGRRRRI